MGIPFRVYNLCLQNMAPLTMLIKNSQYFEISDK